MKTLPMLGVLILLSLVGKSDVAKTGFLVYWRDKIADKLDLFNLLKVWKTKVFVKEIKELTKQMKAVNAYLLSVDESLERFLFTYRRFVSLVVAHQKLARLGVVLFHLIAVHEQQSLERMIDYSSRGIINTIDNVTRHINTRKIEASLDDSLINLNKIYQVVQNRWTK